LEAIETTDPPGDGVDRLLKGIKKAKKNIEIVIFRFDRDEITRALVEAVERGVFVHTLIAFTKSRGEKETCASSR